jgi:hypothetical protein
MNRIFEASYSDEAKLRDGGFIFQAILSYDLYWVIEDGETVFDQKDVSARLHQVDAFPDMKFQEGYATLAYVILSEVTLLKRKLDLATEEIKKRISPEYAAAFEIVQEKGPDADVESLELPEPKKQLGLPEPQKSLGKGQDQLDKGQETLDKGQDMLNAGQGQLNKGQDLLNKGQEQLPPGQKSLPEPKPVAESLKTPALTAAQMKALNDKYFKGTRFGVRFTTKRTVLREVSTSGQDSGRPSVTLKLSTGMVNTLDGKEINSWEGFSVAVSGGFLNNFIIDESSEPPISKIMVYDQVDNVTEQIFKTILPSLTLEFSGDRVQIDTYSNRSSQVAVRSAINFDTLFEPDLKKTPIEEPIEGEDVNTEEEAAEEEGKKLTPKEDK